MKKIIAFIFCFSILLPLTSCLNKKDETSDKIEESKVEIQLENLSKDTYYGFSFTQALDIKKDDGKVLTSGQAANISCTVKDVPLTHGDWFGKTHSVSLFEEKEGAYYLKNDFGNAALLHKSSIAFSKTAKIPERVELFYSDDGYNFNFFAGEMKLNEENENAVFSYEFDTPKTVKAVKYYIYSPVNTTNTIVGIKNDGERLFERQFVSVGAAYTHNGSVSENRTEKGRELTDRVFGGYKNVDEAYVVLKAKEKDELTKLSATDIIIDLGENKNVSEVQLSSLVGPGQGIAQEIDFVAVKYSLDNESYKDFCTAFAESKDKGLDFSNFTRTRFAAMRNHTVEARYIKVQVFSKNSFAIDEISVYGGQAVSEPNYNFNRDEFVAHTDILEGIGLKDINENYITELTNGQYRTPAVVAVNANKATIECEINDAERLNRGTLSGAAIFLPEDSYKNIKEAAFIISADNSEEKRYVFDDALSHTLAGMTNLNAYFDIPVSSSAKIRFEFLLNDGYTKNNIDITGVQLYCGNAQRPLISGGFYGFFIDYIEGYNKHHCFDEYRIFLLLKGYKELGMTYIVGPNNMDYNDKKILVTPNEALAAKGYKKTAGHGTWDVNKAILDACDKLGIDVFLSTVISKTYPELTGTLGEKRSFYESVVGDADILIKQLYDSYKDHPSFKGFYLTDETCDYWMSFNSNQATSIYRTLYEGQSKVIRSLDDDLKIMIAPAAWRSDTPKNFANNMYNLIKPETEGAKPVIDIVAMQDCLGREPTLAVPDAVYAKFEEYLIAVSKAVREANAEFFNDAEVFDVGYKGKRFDEIINSLNLEYKYTAGTIIYDLPHYFSSQGRGSFDSYFYFDFDYIVAQYVKYYQKYNA